MRFDKSDAEADLDELIILHRAIFGLHPLGHHAFVESIDKLLFYLRKRVQRLGIMADLDECVTLGRGALAMHEPSEPGYATCFRRLVADVHTMYALRSRKRL